ncbi:cell division protein FtsL [Vagococcus intermedius]|uniref:Cell division protein FtsL n=1 Tax=Vagococcus intermedius TaxID=2991418 RepID=A0AAF0CVM1_9ENTE|nr:cell division protein FtsL [Vagococcus intermedius]WEG73855.1 cell division protein FtsL [Vagococcus intermedius]WEG75940.1 cell division protein FtsL [Vagococcus intermedius]
MPELKKYDTSQLDRDQSLPKEKVAPKVIEFPHTKLKSISKLEKNIMLVSVGIFILLAIMTVKLTVETSQLVEEISVIQVGVNDKLDKVNKLDQERSELSRASRLKGLAETAGMEVNDDNVRNVEK